MDGGWRRSRERALKDDWKRVPRDERSLKPPRDRSPEESDERHHDSKRSRRGDYDEPRRHSPTRHDIPRIRRLGSPHSNSSPFRDSMSPVIGPEPEDQPQSETHNTSLRAPRYEVPNLPHDEKTSSFGHCERSRSPSTRVHIAEQKRSHSGDDDQDSNRPSHRHRYRRRRYTDDNSIPQSRSQSRSRSPRRSHQQSRKSSSRKDKDYAGEKERSNRLHHRHRKERSLNSSKKPLGDERSKPDRSSNAPSENEEDVDYPSPSLLTRPLRSTKMDRYFDPNYDPTLDYQPSLKTDEFVQEGAFDDWDTMLELVRARREDREERKRKERLGISISSDAAKGIVYKKRGSVREWDLGKE